MFKCHHARRGVPVLGLVRDRHDRIARCDDRSVDHIHAVNAVRRVLVEGIGCVVAENFFAGQPFVCVRGGFGVLKGRRAKDRCSVFSRRVDHLASLHHANWQTAG